ncbi:MAG: RDD family protein [Pseudomonadota bacterium]
MSGAPGRLTPGLGRRLACMLYDGLLLFAVAFFATWLFQFAAGSVQLEGWRRHLLQAFLVAVFAAYFLWCWLRGGQTLAMKTWRIRLVDITPRKALLRFLYALIFVPTGISLLWALLDREQQFLHDHLAGTRLVLLSP